MPAETAAPCGCFSVLLHLPCCTLAHGELARPLTRAEQFYAVAVEGADRKIALAKRLVQASYRRKKAVQLRAVLRLAEASFHRADALRDLVEACRRTEVVHAP